MKKILFCAAVAALAAACTNEDDLVLNQEKASKGLTFDVALAENAVTRGELWRDDNGTYPFFWYAEQDHINVNAINVDAGASNRASNGVASQTSGVWSLASAPASYKATVSEGNGRFTAADAANMLALKDYKTTNAVTKDNSTATIVATYGIAASAVTSNLSTSGGTRPTPGSIKKLTLTTVSSNAAQTVARPNQVIAPMYSVSSAKKEHVYDSFGEKARLQMVRPFPVVRFTTQNTADYIDDLGKLKSVTLTMLGGKKADDSAITPSAIVYDASKDYTVIGSATEVGPAAGFTPATSNNAVKVTVTDGTWTDDDAVYMTVAPVSRKTFRDNNAQEGIEIVYEFENITFTLNPNRNGAADFEKILVTNNDWTAVTSNGNPNAITPLPALDINNYDYLVTKVGSDYTLIVIKGTFSGAFLANGDVNWGAGVPKTSITKIRSNVALTTDELAMLKDFKKLKELELDQNTTIPANTFASEHQTSLTKLILPAVTEIKSKFLADNADAKFSKLTDLNLASYNFPDATINKSFFDSTSGTLKNLNIASVQTMLPTFGVERELSFKNFSKLETVKVYDGVQLSSSAFEGCSALKTVTGKVNVSGAVNAFALATAGGALTTINITGTDIPNAAFKNQNTLKTIKKDGAQVAPTSVGESAFAGCAALEFMNLANAATIGTSAFDGASKFQSNADGSQVLTVGAATISARAFAGTAVGMVDFTNATVIEPEIFSGVPAAKLKQVRFNKVFTGKVQNNAADWNGTFGTASNVVLFVDAAQTHVKSNVLELPYYSSDKKNTLYTPETFKGIYNN